MEDSSFFFAARYVEGELLPEGKHYEGQLQLATLDMSRKRCAEDYVRPEFPLLVADKYFRGLRYFSLLGECLDLVKYFTSIVKLACRFAAY